MFDLLLDTSGLVLKRNKGRFLVRHKTEGVRTFSPFELRTIVVGARCLISTGALQLAITHGIPVLLLDKLGRPAGRVWSPSLEGLADLRVAQAFFSVHPVALQWIVHIFLGKADQQIEILDWLTSCTDKETAETIAARDTLRAGMAQLAACAREAQPPDTLRNRIMVLEAGMAKSWWAAIASQMPTPWSFENRSRRPAKDPFNAGLNYLYGMLYGTTETALMRAGLDPQIGVLHAEEYNRPVLVYDFIERYRPQAERLWIQLCLENAIPPSGFEPWKGGVRLGRYGKRLLIPRYYEWLEERIDYKGQKVKRINTIARDARALAGLMRTIELPDAIPFMRTDLQFGEEE